MPTLDHGLGEVLADVLAASHRLAPREIPALVQEAGRRLGLSRAWVYVADMQQGELVALPTVEQAQQLADGCAPVLETLPVDTSLAGRAYRTETVQLAAVGDRGDRVGWLPLVDGVGRLGVLRVAAPALEQSLVDRCQALASLTAMILATKRAYSDVLAQTVRRRTMTLQAELLWAFVRRGPSEPPR
ncbi:hypothetical protein [Streptacidiphilus melanogenes]|uniref:hypothetical protein n=1 Tax=Streptacidiphilus melanogenes TaxID=411235 RepID=UPI000ADD6019|nr:hypothetical protein [Streptacidiphilus melanogenes]